MLKKILPGLLLCLSLINPSLAGLSSSDWKGLQKELVGYYKNKNYEGLGGVFEKIAQDDSKRAVQLIEKVLQKTIDQDPCYCGALKALRLIKSQEGREEIGKRATKSSTNWKIRLLLVDVISRWEGKEGASYLIQNISTSVQRVASASIRLVAKKGDQKAIDPLIQKMMKLDRKKGVLWEDCKYALTELLGNGLSSGIEYKSFVASRGYGKQVTGSGVREDNRRGSVEKTFFGMSINCQRSVFIIDVSGSMKAIDPEPLGGGGHYGTTRRDENQQNKLDPERMRIRRAKKELIKVIGLLKSSQSFNIIAYSHDVWVWSKGGCKTASSSNKASAVRFVENLKAEGVTVTDLALVKAYQTSPKAECFYLLSDGAPTRDGTNIIPTQDILELILQYDRFRRIKIHTLGFQGASVEFMKAVANLTSGNYRDIK